MTVGMATSDSAKTAAPPALDKISARIAEHNVRLQDILLSAQAFTARVLEEDQQPEPERAAPVPQGKLGDLDSALDVHNRLLNDLRDTVNTLERIG